MIYRCENCGKYALEEDIEFLETTYESYYGVSSEFPNRTRMDVSVCPWCNTFEFIRDLIGLLKSFLRSKQKYDFISRT